MLVTAAEKASARLASAATAAALKTDPPAEDGPVAALPKSDAGTLLVETTPPGARVLLDGKARGESPVTVTDLPAGRHKLVIESRDGIIRRTVTIRAGERTIASEAILPGWLSVFSRIPFEISAGARKLGSTDDGQLTLPPGRHEVTLVSERFNYRETRTFEIQPEVVTSHTMSLPMGSVQVTAAAGTEIWIEGERAGEAPLGEQQVPIGTREIVAKHPQHGERRQVVEVRYGATAEVTFDPPSE